MREIIIFLSCICLTGCRPIHQAVSSYDMSLLPSDFGGVEAYGWQITHEDEDVVSQAYEISRFFQIYQNSF